MTKYWIVHSKVDWWRGVPNSTDFFISHKIWYTNNGAIKIQARAKKIKVGDKIAYKDAGEIKAVGTVVGIGGFQPYPLFFLELDKTFFSKKFQFVLRETLHGPYEATNEKVKTIWGDEG